MRKEYIILFILIIFSFGLTFLQIYPMWDDWTVYNMPYEVIKSQFIGNGLHNFGLSYLHLMVNYIFPNIIGIRVFNFLLHFLTGLFFYKILLEFKIPKGLSFLTFSLFIITPLYSIKAFQIVTPYNLCILFFTVGAYLYLINKKFFSAILFFISFITNSLLFFFFPVFILLNRCKLFKRDLLFLGLPFVFYILKKIISKPAGLYAIEGYNELTIKGLAFNGPIKTFATFILFPKNLVSYLWNLNPFDFLILIPLLVLSLIFSQLIAPYFNQFKDAKINSKEHKTPIIVALILLLSAVYPYAVVNKMPIGLFYESRHQALMGFGLALLIAFLYRSIVNKNRIMANVFITCTITSFVFLNLSFQKDLLANSYNQVAFFKYIIKESETNQSKFIFVNNENKFAEDLNDWRFYELGGYLRLKSLPRNKIIVNTASFKLINEHRSKLLSDQEYNVDQFDTLNYNIDTVKFKMQRSIYILHND